MADEEQSGHKEQPIIIKKIKKGGHGHHGGAWKVAYADFVTAMMAFFIVMWILAASNEATKAAISEYFNDPGAFDILTGSKIPVAKTDVINLNLTGEKNKNDGKDGEGKKEIGWNQFLVGDPQDISQIGQYEGKVALVVVDSGTYKKLEQAKQDSIANRNIIQATGTALERELDEELAKRPDLRELFSSVKIEMTDEGLRIELIESEESLFFQVGSAKLKKDARDILMKLGREIGKLPNYVEIEGHTDSRKYSKNATYTNWELSSDRAHAARHVIENYLWDGQITKVTGFADKKLRTPGNPFSVENRRISILVRQENTQEIMAGYSSEEPEEETSEAGAGTNEPETEISEEEGGE